MMSPVEYKIKFTIPAGYDPRKLFVKLPSPIHKPKMAEIYNYRIENDGFYFVDSLLDSKVASVAFSLFVDEALANDASVEITKLKTTEPNS